MIIFDRKKDKVAIIAPSSAAKDQENNFDLKKSESLLKVAISLFEKYGFSCQYDDNIFSDKGLSYFAAPKSERLRQLKEAIEDPEVKIISMFRGGYGAGEVVFDCLKIKPSSPKIFVGYSDATAIHFLFNQHYEFPSIHGSATERHKHMMEEMVSVLSGHSISFALSAQNELALNGSTLSDTNISGKMTGGNLTLVCNMIGTKLHPVFKDKILFLEDINEKGYQIHRHLLHMSNAGLFEQVKAVIFCDFTQSDNTFEASIENFTSNYLNHVPVFRSTGIGHGETNLPIALGANALINKLNLSVESPFKLI